MPTTMDDLPEEVFLHILSFLPTFDAIRISSLSRKRLNLWHSIPILNFQIFPFDPRFQDYTPRGIRRDFAEFITHTLLRRRRRTPLRTFRLFFDYADHDRYIDHVDSWLLYAVNSDVLEIDFDFDIHILKAKSISRQNDDVDMSYVEENKEDSFLLYAFHFADLVDSSVEVLKLRGCLLRHSPTIRVSSLKSLYIAGNNFDGVEISDVVSVCVNLEFLSIEAVEVMGDLTIISPTLRELKIRECRDHIAKNKGLEIFAPRLRSISFISFRMGKYVLNDVSSLTEAHVEFDSRNELNFACWSHLIKSLRSVERLTVQNMWIWSWFELQQLDEQFMHDNDEGVDGQLWSNITDFKEELYRMLLPAEDVFSKSFSFNNLKQLELLTGYTKYDLFGLEALLEICPRLESMVLKYSYQTDHNDNLAVEDTGRSIILHMPSLRVVKMKNFMGTKNELYVVRLLKRHKMVLEKIVVFPAEIGGTFFSPFVL